MRNKKSRMKLTKKQCLGLLKKYGIKGRGLKHSLAVNKFAIKIAKKIKGVDLDLVNSASLLHDIGRFRNDKTKKGHGVEGFNILKKEGYPEIARTVKKHTLKSINKLRTMEEKIVNYADKRTEEEKIVSLKKRFKDLKKKHPNFNPKKYILKYLKLEKELKC